jgi:hypothetical protein
MLWIGMPLVKVVLVLGSSSKLHRDHTVHRYAQVMLPIPNTKCLMAGFFNNTMTQIKLQAPPRIVFCKSCTLK